MPRRDSRRIESLRSTVCTLECFVGRGRKLDASERGEPARVAADCEKIPPFAGPIPAPVYPVRIRSNP